MKPAAAKKLINGILIVLSLTGYMEWGYGSHIFIAEAEVEVLGKLFTNPMAVLHPLTLLPLAGQLLLLYTLFQKEPVGWLTFIGSGCISILLLIILLTGILSTKTGVIASCIPFLATWIFAMVYYYRQRAKFSNKNKQNLQRM